MSFWLASDTDIVTDGTEKNTNLQIWHSIRNTSLMCKGQTTLQNQIQLLKVLILLFSNTDNLGHFIFY